MATQIGEQIEQTLDNDVAVQNSNLGPALEQVMDVSMDGAENIPGYLEQIVDSFAKRQDEVKQSVIDYKAGEMDANTGVEWVDSLVGDAQLKIQGIGKGIAGPVMDTIGVGVGATIDGIQFTMPVTSKAVEDVVSYAWDWTMKTEGGQAAQEAFAAGGEIYAKWKEENPQYAKTFESIVLAGLVITPAKGKPKKFGAKPIEGPMLETSKNDLNKISTTLVQSGEAQAKKERFEATRALLAPAITKENIKQRGPEGESSLIPSTTFQNATLKPSAPEIAVIEHIASLKNINPKKGASDAIIKIQALQTKLDDEIGKILRSKAVGGKPNLVYIPNSAIDFRIKTNLDAIKNTPALKSQKQVQDLFDLYSKEASKIMKNHDTSPLGYHNARIEWDKFIKTEVGQEALDAATPGLRSEIARQIRNAINSGVDDLVPANSVKSRRTSQNLNYRAIDNLAPKAVLEIEKAIGKTFQNTYKVSRAKSILVGTMATMASIGGYSIYSGALGKATLVTVASLAGAVTLAFGGNYLKKGAMSAKAKTNYGKFVSQIDRAIKDAKNPDMRLSLRRNRVIIASLLNLPTENVDAKGDPL
tara:strand:+ start:178 stop:1938 length:1761 start_codon:yes stop_codon:yes gene_type:complete